MNKLEGIVKKIGRYARNTVAGVSILSSIAFAQNYNVHGTIRSLERTTGTSLESVRVDVDSSSYLAKTDANGNFSVSVPSGNHSIRFSKDGYKGFFRQSLNLTSDSTFNVSMADTMQESPSGNIPLKVSDYKELNRSNSEFPNSLMWRNVTEGNLIPVYLSGANSNDSSAFKQAIGSCDGNWQDSPTNSVEYKQKRAIYQLSNDNQVGVTKKGVKVNFHAGATVTGPLAHEDDPQYMYITEVNLAVDNDPIIKKELFGRVFEKGDVFDRSSYMNSDAADITDLDHMLNIVFFNHWAAMDRGEQSATIYDMEETPIFSKPNSSTVSSPSNNSTGVPLETIIKWSNSYGSDAYHLQVGDSTFSNLVVDDSTMQCIHKSVILNPNTKYFARVRAKNTAGTSSWSAVDVFTTLAPVLSPFAINKPVDGDSVFHDNVQVPISWSRSTGSGALTYIMGVREFGADTNITTIITQDTLASISSHILKSNTKYTLDGRVTDGVDTVSATNAPSFYTSTLTGVDKIANSIPKDFELYQNYPNPFNPTTNIRYTVKDRSEVDLTVYNLLGQAVNHLVHSVQNPGTYEIQFVGKDKASGIYFYRIEEKPANGKPVYTQTKKMVLTK